jgi:hypothetical protein
MRVRIVNSSNPPVNLIDITMIRLVALASS